MAAGIKPRSAKGKGRSFEKSCAADVLEVFHELGDGDVMCSHASDHGKDMLLSQAARVVFPYAVEAKNHKALKMPAWIRQAARHAAKEPGLTPVVVFKQHGNKKKYVTMEWDHFLWLRRELANIGNQGDIQHGIQASSTRGRDARVGVHRRRGKRNSVSGPTDRRRAVRTGKPFGAFPKGRKDEGKGPVHR